MCARCKASLQDVNTNTSPTLVLLDGDFQYAADLSTATAYDSESDSFSSSSRPSQAEVNQSKAVQLEASFLHKLPALSKESHFDLAA